jgi:uncharacterized protein
MTPPSRFNGHYPSRAPIDAYGNGGFRFADMSHRGAILCLPDGVHASTAATVDAIALEALACLQYQPLEPHLVLLVGSGRRQVFATAATRAGFASAGLGLEVMDTGAACRTFNILLAEKRPVAAALLAVA